MRAIREDWTEASLGQVCHIVGGSTPKTTVPRYWGGEIPWITPGDLSGYSAKSIARGARSLTAEGYDSCSAVLVPPGTVLYTTRAPIGYVAIASGEVCTNQGFKNFVPGSEILSDYLYWYLRWTTPMIQTLGTGTTFKEVSKRTIGTVPIRFPSRSEQRRIVEFIEEQFSRLYAAEAALFIAIRKLIVLRTAATAAMLKTNEPSRPLGEIADVISGPAFKSEYFGKENDGIRLLRGENIEPGALRWRETKTWPTELLCGYEHLHVSASDIILAMDRPVISTGLKLTMVRETDLPALLVQRVARIRPHDGVNKSFLFYALSQPSFVRHVVEDQTGTQLPHITLGAIRGYQVPVPSLTEQMRVVSKLDAEISSLQETEVSIRTTVAHSQRLRRRVLETAFAGRFTTSELPNEGTATESSARQ